MIYLLVYLAIGCALSVYLPIQRTRTREKIKHLQPEKLAAMTPGELAIMRSLISTIETDYKPWALVVAGLLWPLQAIGLVFAHVYTWRINRRAKKRHECTTVAKCPSCNLNLVLTRGTDCIEANDKSGIVRFVCGFCATGSEWDFGHPVPIYLRTIKVTNLDDAKR